MAHLLHLSPLTQMEQMDSPTVSVCRPFVTGLVELLRLGNFSWPFLDRRGFVLAELQVYGLVGSLRVSSETQRVCMLFSGVFSAINGSNSIHLIFQDIVLQGKLKQH
jgi:hypothetical protein